MPRQMPRIGHFVARAHIAPPLIFALGAPLAKGRRGTPEGSAWKKPARWEGQHPSEVSKISHRPIRSLTRHGWPCHHGSAPRQWEFIGASAKLGLLFANNWPTCALQPSGFCGLAVIKTVIARTGQVKAWRRARFEIGIQKSPAFGGSNPLGA